MSAQRVRSLLGLLVLACASSGCALLEGPRRRTVAWGVVETTPKSVGCATATAHVARTGKEGMGVVVTLRGRDTNECNVQNARVSLLLENGLEVRAKKALPEMQLTSRETVEVYVPLYFDNNDAWNRGVRRGKLELRLGDERVSLAIYHRVEGGEP